jgi:hypothetical protein
VAVAIVVLALLVSIGVFSAAIHVGSVHETGVSGVLTNQECGSMFDPANANGTCKAHLTVEADISAALVGVAVVVLSTGILLAVARLHRRRFNRLSLLAVGCVAGLAAFFWWIGWTSKIARYAGS